MTEIPEHLRKRAEEARAKAEAKKAAEGGGAAAAGGGDASGTLGDGDSATTARLFALATGAGFGGAAALEEMGRDARVGGRLCGVTGGRGCRTRVGGRCLGGLVAGGLRPLQQVFWDLGHRRLLLVTADRRCLRPCGPARSGSP